MCPVSCRQPQRSCGSNDSSLQNVTAAKRPRACYPTGIQEWRAKIVINNVITGVIVVLGLVH